MHAQTHFTMILPWKQLVVYLAYTLQNSHILYSQLVCLLDFEEKAHYAYHIMPPSDVRIYHSLGPVTLGGQHPLETLA